MTLIQLLSQEFKGPPRNGWRSCYMFLVDQIIRGPDKRNEELTGSFVLVRMMAGMYKEPYIYVGLTKP